MAVIIETTKGDMIVDLYTKARPKSRFCSVIFVVGFLTNTCSISSMHEFFETMQNEVLQLQHLSSG